MRVREIVSVVMLVIVISLIIAIFWIPAAADCLAVLFFVGLTYEMIADALNRPRCYMVAPSGRKYYFYED